MYLKREKKQANIHENIKIPHQKTYLYIYIFKVHIFVREKERKHILKKKLL